MQLKQVQVEAFAKMDQYKDLASSLSLLLLGKVIQLPLGERLNRKFNLGTEN